MAVRPFSVFILLALSSGCASAAPQAEAETRLRLFDGESLAGWRVTEENADSFRIENGTIMAQGERAHLFYDGPHGTDFTNFILTLKVKTRPSANSGVYFHTAYQAIGWPSVGLEAQVNATQSDFRKTGSLYAIADIRAYGNDADRPALGFDRNAYVTRAAAPHVDDEWFDYEIQVQDGTVSTRVNGVLQVQWTQPEDWDNGDIRLSSGTFALQAHDPGSTVFYKDIMVELLD
jgi:3-keto-disaccharide hydrolase